MQTSDNLTSEQRTTVERLKRERAQLTTPSARIAFDNDSRNGSFALRIIAMTETTEPVAVREP